MNKNLQKFGKKLKELRIKRGLTLRKICETLNYDPSNWSKIERGIISPPANERALASWARVLGISKSSKDFQEFIDEAKIAHGIIPQDILTKSEIIGRLPALFRTLRNEKPTKEEIDRLIELIRGA